MRELEERTAWGSTLERHPLLPWLIALSLVGVVTGCSTKADTDCLGNSDCESNQCVGGRCIPLDFADGGDTRDVLPDGDTPPGDVLDTSGEDPPSDPLFDPSDDPQSDPTGDAGLELQEDPDLDLGVDVAPTGPNACGGTVPLLVDGAPSLPQASCGATGSGFLACNGVDALLCVGEPAPNACGGAGVLRATPGDACGCGGVWTCAGGAVVCAGGSDENTCGGCAALPALPGYACRAGDGTTGAWQCTSGDSLWCGSGNACGGTTPLQPAGRLPGQACDSACGPGVLVCSGTEALQCRPTYPCNTCGGAAALAGDEGEPCGAFRDGTWVCEDGDRVRCEDATQPNACGGPDPLTAAPGDSCEGGRRLLCANGRLECGALLPVGTRNACGGDTPLEQEPGTPCGICEGALWQCDGRNAVQCPMSDDLQRNACGGCGLLAGTERTPCGACGDGRLQCNETGSALDCVGATQAPNACGGCGSLEGSVGDDCGTCGRYACSVATRRLVCEPRPLGSCPDVPVGTLGSPCTNDSGCSTGEWCATNTAQRRCAPRPSVGPVQMPFQFVPSGSFTMGSPSGEVGRASSEAQVSVTLSRSFFLQRTEITQSQWTALSGGTNPSCFQANSGMTCSTSNAHPNGPVETVSWWSVLEYANALSAAQDLPACYTLPLTGCSGTWQAGTLDCGNRTPTVTGGNVYACTGYRLPTEAEWEYAARAGTSTATYGGNLSGSSGCVTLSGAGSFVSGTPLADLAWYTCNASSRTRPVGGKSPNPWGLYDMLGNAWEWVWDRDGTALPGGTDPRSEAAGSYRGNRGGGWESSPQSLRAAHRGANPPGSKNQYVGARLARTAP